MKMIKWKSIMAGCLAATMAVSMAPIPTWAATKSQVSLATGSKLTGAKKSEKTNQGYKDGEAIVYYYEDTTNAKTKASSIAFGSGIKIQKTEDFGRGLKDSNMKSKDHVKVSLVKSSTKTTDEIIAECKKKSNVKYAEPNYKIKALDCTDDTFSSYQWAMENQTTGGEDKDIKPTSAWEKADASTSTKERVIALVDTGIDYTNEDLKDVVWNNPDTDSLSGEHGYDCINMDADPLDDNGHGSHCSGIMAATKNNKKGVAGVNSKAKIMGLKILDSEGYGYGMEAVQAYNYIYKAQKLGVNVVAVNNSWGGVGPEESEILKELIDLVGGKGAISCCASGNEYSNNDKVDTYPANIDSDYIVSVGASNREDKLVAFSNYGKNSVDIAAPGADILSTVSYDCFNPSIYTDEQKEALCATPAAEDLVGGAKLYEMLSGDVIEGTVDNDNGFEYGQSDSKAMKYTYKNETTGDFFNSSAAVVLYPADKVKKGQYYSFTIKIIPKVKEGAATEFDTEVAADWSVVSGKVDTSQTQTIDGVKYVILNGLYLDQVADYTFYLDNVAISKEGVEASQFGKYDWYSGTSMATPFVTGSVSLLDAAYPGETVQERKARLLSCVRKVSGMDQYIKTGGVLDLSKSNELNPWIDSATLQENQLTLKGAFFGETKGTVKINSKAVDEKNVTWKKDSIVVSDVQASNKKVTIEIETKDNKTASLSQFFSYASKKMTKESVVTQAPSGKIATDGNNLYVLDSFNSKFSRVEKIVDFDEETGKEVTYYGTCVMENPVYSKFFPEETAKVVDVNEGNSFVSDLQYYNGGLYGVAECNLGYSNLQALVRYDIEKDSWNLVASVPKELVQTKNYAMGICNDKVYFVGGLDKNAKVVKTTWTYDFSLKTFAKDANADLPTGRALGKLVCTPTSMVYTLGTDGTNDLPANIIFDGKDWKTSAVKEVEYEAKANQTYEFNQEKSIAYFDAETGICKQGIAYVGLTKNGLGDVYVYNTAKDSYETTDYCIQADKLKDKVNIGTIINDKFYLISGTNEAPDDEEDFSKKDMDSSKDLEEEEDDTENYLYSFPVSSAYVQVDGELNRSMGVLFGEGYYLPGSMATIHVDPMKGYYFVSYLDEDGEVVSTKNPYQFKVTKDCTVMPNVGVLTTDLEITPKEATVEADSTYELSAKTTPVDATSQDFTWTSSNNSYATVDQKGVVKGLKAGIGQSVVITATTKDGSKITATATVKIVAKAIKASKVTLAKLSSKTLYVGKTKKLRATVSPANANDKGLIWSSSNANYATVSATGVVKAKAAGAGKTVTITVKARSNEKAFAKVKIKIKAIALKKITLNKKKATLKVKKQLKLKAKFNPTNTSYKSVTWSTSNKKYATVSKKGVVTAKKAGKGKTVKITVTSNYNKKIKAVCKIKIK